MGSHRMPPQDEAAYMFWRNLEKRDHVAAMELELSGMKAPLIEAFKAGWNAHEAVAVKGVAIENN